MFLAKATKDPFDILQAAADNVAPDIAESFMISIQDIEGNISQAEINQLLEDGNYQAITELFSAQMVDNSLQTLAAQISAAVMIGGQVSARVQPSVNGLGGQVSFVFNQANPKVNSYAQRVSAQRVREVGNDIRLVLNQVIRDGVTRGDNPITTARRIKRSIGLTAHQERAVDNYRRALEEGDMVALRRELRDKRFDPTVLRSIRNDKALTPAQIDRMVQRYREKYLKYRSEAIGRTESIRAIQGAQYELIQSYIDNGQIDYRQVKRFWKTAGDGNVREAHVAVPRMNPNGVAQGEAFKTPLGALMFPGDPAGSAANTVHCRCTVFSRVISKELIDG